MDRKIYQPTEKQLKNWAIFDERAGEMPSDDEFKARAKKEHKPWGILKRDYIVRQMSKTSKYQLGLWQGRVDKLRGLDYSEERSENTYNLGYYRGYVNFDSDWGGLDAETRRRLLEEYGGEDVHA